MENEKLNENYFLTNLIRERRNPDLPKDISRHEQHLSPLCVIDMNSIVKVN